MIINCNFHFGSTLLISLFSSERLLVCARKRVGGLKLEDLPGLEALQVPGVINNADLLKH